MEDPKGKSPFPDTRWSVVMRARDAERTTSAWQALSRLCEDYWYPVYAYARRRGKSPHDAQDLTQSFFAHILAKDLFASAEPEMGKLRTFLLTAFERHMTDQYKYENRLKRGGACEFVSIDDGEARYAEEPIDIGIPAKLFEHTWAFTVLDMTLRELGENEARAGRADTFKALEPFLTPGGEESANYQTAAEELGTSVDSTRHAVHRLRKQFREVLRKQIAETLRDPTDAEIDQEIAALRRALTA